MQVARLGRTGLKVTRMCLGTMTFGVQCDEAQSVAILDRAAEGGISFIDTADGYPLFGNPGTVGMTEEILGRWLRGKRHNFVVATKCFAAMGPNPWDRGTSRRHIMDAVEGSLRRLRTDFIDLYQLHMYDPEVPIDESLEAMDALVKSGKVRYIGCSNWPAFRLARALGRSELNRWARFDCVQPRYSLLFRAVGARSVPAVPGGGHRDDRLQPAGRRAVVRQVRSLAATRARVALRRHAFSNTMYWNDAAFESLEQLRGVADELGMSLPTLSLAWVLAQPAVTAPIVGASRPEHLDAAFAALDAKLSDDVLQRLDEITRQPPHGRRAALVEKAAGVDDQILTRRAVAFGKRDHLIGDVVLVNHALEHRLTLRALDLRR